ncbi:MAG: two-component system response regulator [Methanomicrobiales archaeon HGW-Methanomicrobiales-4]|nr:MAG: two-component system response regulator [Methanomicrobiales archaeon HGW-Methanomicrobiales-4]
MSVAILIVDDEPALNDLFVVGLNKYGYATEGVLGGRECLDLLKTAYQPDLILLDMMMEPMDGWETLHHIKADLQSRMIPVIMQTGKNLTYKEAEKFSFYIEDYIMKPITPKRCVDFIEDILEKRRKISTFIDQVRRSGSPEDQIERLINLHQAIDVSKRLMALLDDRYGASSGDHDSESYGPEEYSVFRERIISEYEELQKKLGIIL